MFKKSQKIINNKIKIIIQDIKNSNISNKNDIKQAIKDDIGEYAFGTYIVPDSSEYYDFYEAYGKFIDKNADKIYQKFKQSP